MSLTLGLISDTHLPDRCRALPRTLREAFDQVDLILHAGDVGALSVLDELAAIAPVIAVHGNDELAGATEVLASQHVVFAAGRRILLAHGHYPDPAEELNSRRHDDWRPKLARWAGMAREVGASVVVYGHTHIPWAVEVDGVWVINPGAIASGGYLQRQVIQTVARLTLDRDAPPDITYIDLATLSPYAPSVTIEAGFGAALTNRSIATPDLLTHRDWLVQEMIPSAHVPAVNAIRRVMFRCYDGEIDLIDTPTLVNEFLAAPDIPDEIKTRIRTRFAETSSG